MKKIENIKELQKVYINILRDFNALCKEKNIKFYLLGGTLLGAVRHKGFIPWDDDIDISISRENYRKLVESFLDKNLEKYILIDPETNDDYKGYIPQFSLKNSKVLSSQFRKEENLKLGISIFIFDGVPDNKIVRWYYYKKMYLLRSLHALCRVNFRYVNTKKAKLIGPILQPFFPLNRINKFKKKILEHQKKYEYLKSNLVAPNTDTNAIKEIVKKFKYEKYEKLNFENIECLVASNYKEHLEKYYGNYMELPPENERIPKHSFSVWVDEEYFNN